MVSEFENASPRIAALEAYDILDTPAEAGFDDLVALASQICETPCALVSLVAKDRQWFKAKIGFDDCETPIGQSVCRHGLQTPGLLIIPDLTQDPRTRDNTLVTGEPFIRFYAGARIDTPEGLGLGMLCVIDVRPRPDGLSDSQQSGLQALARQASTQMELRRTAAARDGALQALREADARHRQILESAVDYAIITMDLDGLVIGWNTGAERILGWTRAEMSGRPARIFLTNEDQAAGVAEDEMRAAREEGRGNDERWHVRKDSSTFWALGKMMPLNADDGRQVGYLKILQDRTEQRRNREALTQQADLLRTITNHVSEGIFQLDTTGLVTFANPAGAAMLGWAPGEILGRDLHEVAHHHHPDGRPFPGSDCPMVQALPRGLGLERREAVFFRRDGSAIDVLVSNSAIREVGQVRGAVLTVVDVTATKAAGEALRRVDERLSFAIQASAAVGWWDWDVVADKVYASENFARLYQVDPAAAADGLPIADFAETIHPEDRPWLEGKIAEALESGGDFAEEYRLAQRDGTVSWVYARGRCYLDDAHRPVRFPGVVVDITERKLAEERQAALVALGDRLRNLSSPVEIAYVAAEIAGTTLGMAGAAYGAVDLGLQTISLGRDWRRGEGPSIEGLHRFEDYGTYFEDLQRGETVAIADVREDMRTQRASLDALGIRSLLNVPLHEQGRLTAVFCLYDDKPRNWALTKLNFMRSLTDRTRAALREQEAEDEQELLNQELSHRMKNLIAMVQAIATQTMRSSADLQSAGVVLSGRLVALSQAHDLLLGGRIGETMLEPIVRGAVKIHEDVPDRFEIGGPLVRIGAKAAMALALMAHELATNATKYGALSSPAGVVEIAWGVHSERAEPMLRLTWTERGGPPVREPSKEGFGSRFVRRALAAQIGGTVEIDYAPAGVVYVVEGPLATLQARE